MYDLIFGGYGGRFDKDGSEALCPVANAANLPIEGHEANNPILFHRFELIPDSGGAGRTSRRLRNPQGRGNPVRRRDGFAAERPPSTSRPTACSADSPGSAGRPS